MSNLLRFWIAGLILVTGGFILAKFISPRYANDPDIQFILFAAGVSAALAGMIVIIIGRRKAKK
jgi:membrane protein DedA with SNARE-associated domain